MSDGAAPAERERERDPIRDVVPLIAASLVAWWTTVRPSGFAIGGTWPPRVAAATAIVGIAVAAFAIARSTHEGLLGVARRHFVAIVLGGFVLPCAATWVLGPESATALSEPIEIFVGAIAWTALGVVLIRPQAVAIPKGAQGGQGPSIGAGDDVARVAMKELDAAVAAEPPPKLVPRQTMPRLGSLPLFVAAGLAGLVGFQVMRIGSNQPDRAVLARIVAAAIGIALLSTAGDLVEVRYWSRKEPPARARLQRGMVAIAIVVLLAFIYFVAFGRDK